MAPNIKRQRLLIEGFFSIDVDQKAIEHFFKQILLGLELKAYGKPIIFSPGGEGKEANQGYDAFIPLIDSGISLYIWSEPKFVSIIIYTCKSFDQAKALEITQSFFDISEIEFQSF